MKKKIIVFSILAAFMAVPVFAATNDQDQEQNQGFHQMFANHQQMMQQAVDNGTITAEQATQMNEHMTQMAPIMQKMMQNGNRGNGQMMRGGNGNSNHPCWAQENETNNSKS
ncbi:MAG: hypothetical protein H6Q70_2611 [Firmicutes bacterium]|nr:hypothetical protein [Bacillota bacterium]